MKYQHECTEWDGMLINETHSEFAFCQCYEDEDAKKFANMHSNYIGQLQQAWQFVSGYRNILLRNGKNE